jgi:DNA (cytosine-5)-methyltransferase 3A
MILSENGYVPIEKIAVGDLVLTHAGNLKKVTAVGSNISDTVALYGRYCGLECTPGHPIYTDDDDWIDAQHMQGKMWGTPSSISCKLNIPEDNFKIKKYANHLNDFPDMESSDTWYYIGRWLGDGYTRNTQRCGRSNGQTYGSIFLCDSNDKAQEIIDCTKKVFGGGYSYKEGSVTKVRVQNIRFCEYIEKHFGTGALNKSVPLWCISLPADCRKSLLMGYADSDGHYEKLKNGKDRFQVCSASKKLILSIRFIAESLGYYTSIFRAKTHDSCINGRVIKSNVEYNYILSVSDYSRYKDFNRKNMHTFYRVKKVVEGNKNVCVYNLSVADDESYIADSIVVHNCTHWSIAQTKNRETEANGLGWELFRNYLIAKEKFNPDFFLYENNKSASQPIKDQISNELGAPLQYINSALVSAQNRQRFYCHNFGDVPQPEDRGILLKDILESTFTEQLYPLAEPVGDIRGKSFCLTSNYANGPYPEHTLAKKVRTMVAEPIRIGTIENNAKNSDHDSQQYRVYSTDGKSVTLCGNGGGLGAKTGLYATPVCLRAERTEKGRQLRKKYESHEIKHGFNEHRELQPRPDGKSNTLSTVQKDNLVAEPFCIAQRGRYVDNKIEQHFEPRFDGKTNTLTTVGKDNFVCERWDGKKFPVYKVNGGLITIKDKVYPIRLQDGFYIIRKLTVTECCRLQTLDSTLRMLYIDFNNNEVVSEKCFAHQKTDAPFAEVRCHKLQKFAKDAQEIDLKEFALSVEKNLNIKSQQTNKLVPLNVHTSYEDIISPKSYSGELLKNANSAENNSSYLNHAQIDVFAQAIVGINIILEKIQQIGEVELRLKGKRFAVIKNGRMQLMLCGQEIIQLVKDASVNIKEVKNVFTSIISEVSQNTQGYELQLTTLFCFVLNAIGGFILTQTKGEILFSIDTPYTYAVSNSQAYKILGNGWTAEVIIHLLNHALKGVPRDEELVVLSMYDGGATGRYCLDKMGFTNVTYYAYEIDKYAMQVANSNYPDIIQCGDAFDLRHDNWGKESSLYQYV